MNTLVATLIADGLTRSYSLPSAYLSLSVTVRDLAGNTVEAPFEVSNSRLVFDTAPTKGYSIEISISTPLTQADLLTLLQGEVSSIQQTLGTLTPDFSVFQKVTLETQNFEVATRHTGMKLAVHRLPESITAYEHVTLVIESIDPTMNVTDVDPGISPSSSIAGRPFFIVPVGFTGVLAVQLYGPFAEKGISIASASFLQGPGGFEVMFTPGEMDLLWSNGEATRLRQVGRALAEAPYGRTLFKEGAIADGSPVGTLREPLNAEITPFSWVFEGDVPDVDYKITFKLKGMDLFTQGASGFPTLHHAFSVSGVAGQRAGLYPVTISDDFAFEGAGWALFERGSPATGTEQRAVFFDESCRLEVTLTYLGTPTVLGSDLRVDLMAYQPILPEHSFARVVLSPA